MQKNHRVGATVTVIIDKDLMQLVFNKVDYLPNKNKVVGEKEVIEKFGVNLIR